jgi:hypothetical protein
LKKKFNENWLTISKCVRDMRGRLSRNLRITGHIHLSTWIELRKGISLEEEAAASKLRASMCSNKLNEKKCIGGNYKWHGDAYEHLFRHRALYATCATAYFVYFNKKVPLLDKKKKRNKKKK